jgi:hypothetical protein
MDQFAYRHQSAGETVMFWVDLSTAGMIDGSFTVGDPVTVPGADITAATTPSISSYLPSAKLGQANYIYAFGYQGVNYFGMTGISRLEGGNGVPDETLALSVAQAYAIDSKLDDGFPTSGRVMAVYTWPGSGGIMTYVQGVPFNALGLGPTASIQGSPTTCYDNNNAAGIVHYSTEQNNGEGLNCALIFMFP